MSVDHKKLRALIDAEPTNAPPATDEAVRAWWVADILDPTDVSRTDVLVWLSGNGGRLRVEAALTFADTDEKIQNSVRNAALLFIDFLRSGQGFLELSRNDVRALLVPLVGDGRPFAVLQRDDLMSLSDVMTPRWKANGFAKNGSWGWHIKKARAT